MNNTSKINKVNIKAEIKDFMIMHRTQIIICCLLVIFLIVTYFWGINITLKEGNNIEVLINTEKDATFIDPGYNSSFYGIPLPFKVDAEGNVKVDKVGEYEVVYSYNFIRKITKIRTVKVVEKEAPVITLKGDSTVKSCPNGKFKEPGYTAYDTYDGEITDNVKIETKDGIVTYTVQDASGNVGTATRNLVFSDETAPVITLSGGEGYTVFMGETFSDPGYTVVDDCLGDISSSVTTEGSVDTNTIGTYTIKYNVSDGTNSASATRNVYVIGKPEENVTSKNPTSIGKIYTSFDSGVYTCTGYDKDYGASNIKIAMTFTNGDVTKVTSTLTYKFDGTAIYTYNNYFNAYPEQFSNVSLNGNQITFDSVHNRYYGLPYNMIVDVLKEQLGTNKWQCK